MSVKTWIKDNPKKTNFIIWTGLTSLIILGLSLFFPPMLLALATLPYLSPLILAAGKIATSFIVSAIWVVANIGLFTLFKQGLQKLFPPFKISTNPLPPVPLTDVVPNLSFITLNIACLPDLPLLNDSPLRPNLVRANEIVTQLLVTNSDIISLQEVFDGKAEALLIDRLRETYPYIIHHVGSKFLNAGSGLMILSKYPIVEAEFHPYTTIMVGTESFSNKGFLACKIQISEGYFISVYNTHTSCGWGAMLEALQNKLWNGTIHTRTDYGFSKLADHMEKWANLAPPKCSQLTRFSTHFMGDLNFPLNLNPSLYRLNDQTPRYPGMTKVFRHLDFNTPLNYKAENPIAGQYKGTFIEDEGLDLDNQGEIAPEHIRPYPIDGMYMKRNTARYSIFQSKIVSFKNNTDHLGVRGDMIIGDVDGDPAPPECRIS